VAGTAKGLY